MWSLGHQKNRQTEIPGSQVTNTISDPLSAHETLIADCTRDSIKQSSFMDSPKTFHKGGRTLGRPSKRTPFTVARILEPLRNGYSMSLAAQMAGVNPKTVQRWLKRDLEFLKAVIDAQIEGLPKAREVAWMNHPFRGKRPPRPKSQRKRSYPTPEFYVPQKY